MSWWSPLVWPFEQLGKLFSRSPNPDVAQAQTKEMANAEGTLGYIPPEMQNSAYAGAHGFNVSNMFGGLAGGLVSGLFGLAGGLASSAMSYSYQKKLLKEQDELQRKYAADAPGITKQGLEKAGINPLVGTSGTTSSEPLNAGSQSVNLSGGISDVMNAASALQQSKSAMKTADTNADVGASTIDLNKANIANNTARTHADVVNNTRLTSAKISEIKAKIDNMRSQTHLNSAMSSYYDRQTVHRGGGVSLGPLGRLGIDWVKK